MSWLPKIATIPHFSPAEPAEGNSGSLYCEKSELFQLAIFDRLHETLSQIIADTTGELHLLDRIRNRSRINERPAESSNISRKCRARSIRRMADADNDVWRRAVRWLRSTGTVSKGTMRIGKETKFFLKWIGRSMSV